MLEEVHLRDSHLHGEAESVPVKCKYELLTHLRDISTSLYQSLPSFILCMNKQEKNALDSYIQ